jgi:glycosyltransferase involved in cell wall biosynthesis
MSARPIVSVIVPVYNSEKTLARCLDSLLAQTLGELEIVVVDDGSNDGSSSLIAQYRDANGGRIVSTSQPNGGRASARNAGLACASGAFIGFVDSDDWVEPQMYQSLVNRAQATDADLVVCDYAAQRAEEPVARVINEGDASQYGTSLSENPRLFELCLGSLCNKLFARGLFGEDPSAFFPAGIDFEDLATVYQLLARAAKIERVDGPPLYHYTQGEPHSIMSSCDERFLMLVDALAVMNAGFREMGAFEQFRTQLLRVNLLHLIFARYSDLFRAAPFALSGRFIDRAFAHLDADFGQWRRADITTMFGTNSGYAFVSTHKPLLKAYVGVLARRAQRTL